MLKLIRRIDLGLGIFPESIVLLLARGPGAFALDRWITKPAAVTAR